MFIVTIFPIIALCFGFAYLISFMHNWNEYRKKINKIPGPLPLPIIGNVLYFMGTPDEVFKNGRKLARGYGNCAKLWMCHLPFVCNTSPEDIEKIISTSKNNTKSDIYNLLHCWLGTGLLTSNGEKWQNRRKILTPSFHFSILQEFLPVFIKESKCLVANLKSDNNYKRTINIIPHITQFTLHSICETAMGTSLCELKGHEKYKEAILEIGEYIVYRFTHPWFVPDFTYAFTKGFWQQRRIAKYLQNFSLNVIGERKKKWTALKEDQSYSTKKKMAMLDILLKAKSTGASIDDEGIREEVDTFMFEGHDTTAMAICFTLMLLANHKEIQEKVYQEIVEVLGTSTESQITNSNLQELKYLERCIKESLRLYPSVPVISRIISEDVESCTGYTIPANTRVIIAIIDVHRNPELYSNPLKFDPDRFLPEVKRHPYAYIPFSAGPRNCIGQKFAMMEMKIVIVEILKNFILEAEDTPDSTKLMIDLVLRPTGEIKVKFLPRVI